jgi:DNA-binding SARP family transcriptional activator
MPQPETDIRVRLLGPVDAVVSGEARRVGGKRRRAVLAALALRCGEVVSADELLGAAWGDEGPASAANTLQSHVSGLRTVLGSKTAILARPPGYVLDLGADGTDVQAAERLLRLGEQAGSPAAAVGHLQEALALWRGRPLAGMDSLDWFGVHLRRLEQLRLQARGMLAQARLALGQHVQLIPELESLTRQYPLHEAFWEQLIVALYRAGRQTDALAAYQQVRRILQDEFGIDPGRPLE